MSRIIEIDGQRYEQTGNVLGSGERVFAKVEEWERACKSFTNELLWVEVAPGKLVPRDEFKSLEGPSNG